MKVRIILPYYGTFNNYFDLWLSSCANNPEIDWLIITDIAIQNRYDLPLNVKVEKMTFEELRKMFERKLKMQICLEKPYKLCDYKPYYGFLFSEYLQGYEFWGYCDCDVIFGHFASFLSSSIYQSYDKIFRTGHLSLIRNKEEINRLFLKYDTYKIVLTSPAIYGYDESVDGYHLGFTGELLKNGYRFLDQPEWIADIDFRYFPFYVVGEAHIPCAFVYNEGKIFQITRQQKKCEVKEMLYLHLQKRKMKVVMKTATSKYIICPNEFLEYNKKILEDESFWQRVSTEKEGYFDFKQEKMKAFARDVVRFFHEPKKIDSLRYRLSGKKE